MNPTWLLGKRLVLSALVAVFAVAQVPGQDSGTSKPKLYNTVKQKVLDGKQVFAYMQYKLDIEQYCEGAKHFDYSWFDMQHSTLSFADIEKMIAACPYAGATPMIRIPDAQEYFIQQATDIGALGIVVPTVDDVEKARAAAKWSHLPPRGRRSIGGGQAATIWGARDPKYPASFNDNFLVVVMIETPTGVANAYDIASVPGVDVLIVGNRDLSMFSGFAQTDDRYQRMIAKVHDDALRAGKIFGQTDAKYASAHPLSGTSKFFQHGGPSLDGWRPTGVQYPSAPAKK